MKVRIINPIKRITKNEVEFNCGSDRITSLRREHNGRDVWGLRDDGIYVEEVFAKAYGLVTG